MARAKKRTVPSKKLKKRADGGIRKKPATHIPTRPKKKKVCSKKAERKAYTTKEYSEDKIDRIINESVAFARRHLAEHFNIYNWTIQLRCPHPRVSVELSVAQ